ncbi:MAG: hypothetical protein JWM74_5250, partial [Myxococcaceae bacterium]|nr:hypothetical protein [Myxococcaceae bacterium]
MKSVLALGLAVSLGGASMQLAACASIAHTDVKLVDAGDATTQVPLEGGGAAQDSGIVLPPNGNSDAGCDCETKAGLGCCMPPGGGAAFCAEASECTGGLYAPCEKYEPDTDSYCCWNNGTSAGGFTAYASACGARPTACTRDDECTG